MIDRFKGWPMIKVACAASIEAQVGYHTCYDVLFKGKPIRSPATQRVFLWAKREGFKIKPPEKASAAKGDVAAESTTEGVLDEAERQVARFDPK